MSHGQSTKGVVDMKSAHEELDEAYESGDMITVCWEEGCSMHRLYYWDDETWVSHQKREDYANYTHSICDAHYREYQQELGQLIEEEEAAATALLTREAAVAVAAS